MTAVNVFAPARPARRAATYLTAAAALAVGTSLALAQTPAPQPPAPAPKTAPRPVQPAQKQTTPPAKQPQQPAQQQQGAPADQQAAQGEQPPVVYSPWTKFCGKDQNPQAKEVCLTVKEARLETGQFLAGAALIEQAGEDKKLFRITLPLGMQLPQGTRMILDKEEPLTGRYVVCLPNGCMADFDVTKDFVGKLKKGQQIVLQGINLPGQAASYLLPLQPISPRRTRARRPTRRSSRKIRRSCRKNCRRRPRRRASACRRARRPAPRRRPRRRNDRLIVRIATEHQKARHRRAFFL